MNKKIIIFTIICMFSKALFGQLLIKGNEFQCIYKDVVFTCHELDDKNISIIKFDGRARTVEFPSEVTDKVVNKSYHVKSINAYSTNAPYLTEEIIINEGIEAIEKKCFLNFKNIKKVILPSTIQWIGKKAFANISLPHHIIFPTAEIKDLLVLSGLKYNQLSDPTGTRNIDKISNDDNKTETIKRGTGVIKVISFAKTNALSARIDQRVDNSNNLCALIKISINGEACYSSDFIPEPAKNFIAYNRKGYDYVWMAANASNLDIYSDKRQFEPMTLNFNKLSNGEISVLESGIVYELKLRIYYEQ